MIAQAFPGYSQVCLAASQLGFTVRRKQAFRDGNHRTALLAIIHLLAQYDLGLDSKTNFVCVYKLLSALHLFVSAREPAKIDENCLTVLQGFETALETAVAELQAYLHRRALILSPCLTESSLYSRYR